MRPQQRPLLTPIREADSCQEPLRPPYKRRKQVADQLLNHPLPSTTVTHPAAPPHKKQQLVSLFQQLDQFWAEVRLQKWILRAHTQAHKNPTQTESQERIRSKDMPRCLMATLATTKERGEDGGGRHERGVWIPWPLERIRRLLG